MSIYYPHSTKMDVFCVRYKYSKHSLGQLWDAIDPKMNTTVSKNKFTMAKGCIQALCGSACFRTALSRGKMAI